MGWAIGLRLARLSPLLAALTLGAAPSMGRAQQAGSDDAVCSDRPGKAYAPCSVPDARFQIETDLYDQTFQQSRGVGATTTFYSNPTLKFGLPHDADLEIAAIPYQTVRVRERTTGRIRRFEGPSDLTLQAKVGLSKAWTLMPFLTLPTAARGTPGVGGVSGGVRAPFSYDLGHGWSVGGTPELDATADQRGGGAHVGTVQVVGLNKDAGAGVSLGLEVWGSWDFDPDHTATQSSLDAMAAWTPPELQTLQLDVQVNVGLNHQTPDLEAIFGVTKRF